jgi:hypothetical protein
MPAIQRQFAAHMSERELRLLLTRARMRRPQRARPASDAASAIPAAAASYQARYSAAVEGGVGRIEPAATVAAVYAAMQLQGDSSRLRERLFGSSFHAVA